MKRFFNWLGAFFAVDNAVNENTVMGTLFSVALVVAIFIDSPAETAWLLSGLVVAFFGLGALKR